MQRREFVATGLAAMAAAGPARFRSGSAHGVALPAPTADQQKQIVDFETGIFTAQIFDDNAGTLHARGATGGPVALSLQLAKFFVGVNDPVGLNPTGLPFDPNRGAALVNGGLNVRLACGVVPAQ